MTASGVQKPDVAINKLVLPVGKSVFSTGLPIPGGEIQSNLGGARRNRPVRRERWRRGWGIQLPTFGGLKPAGIAGNTDLSVTVAGKPVRRHSGGKRPNPVVAARGEEGAGAECPFGGEGKTLGLPLIRNRSVFVFHWFCLHRIL
jgi:hypothetical protein